MTKAGFGRDGTQRWKCTRVEGPNERVHWLGEASTARARGRAQVTWEQAGAALWALACGASVRQAAVAAGCTPGAERVIKDIAIESAPDMLAASDSLNGARGRNDHTWVLDEEVLRAGVCLLGISTTDRSGTAVLRRALLLADAGASAAGDTGTQASAAAWQGLLEGLREHSPEAAVALLRVPHVMQAAADEYLPTRAKAPSILRLRLSLLALLHSDPVYVEVLAEHPEIAESVVSHLAMLDTRAISEGGVVAWRSWWDGVIDIGDALSGKHDRVQRLREEYEDAVAEYIPTLTEHPALAALDVGLDRLHAQALAGLLARRRGVQEGADMAHARAALAVAMSSRVIGDPADVAALLH